MRRADPISVRVRAPSRGLVTRLPRESADTYRQSDSQRVATNAENVRYEDGVIKNAPGFTAAQFIGSSSVALGAISHWRMDEATFDIRKDVITNFLNLAPLTPLAPDTTLIQDAGKIGKSVHWQAGTHEQTLFTPNPTVNFSTLYQSSFSIGFWFKADAAGDNRAIIQGDGWRVLNSSAGHVTFQVFTAITTFSASTGAITPGTWYYVTLVYDSSAPNIKAYLNTSASTTSVTGTLAPVFSPGFSVGSGIYTSGFSLDSLTIWNRALLSGEVTSLYNSGNGLDFPFLSGSFSLLYQANLIGSLPTPLIGATGGAIDFLDRSFVSNVFYLTPTKLFTGSAPSTGYPWTATDFFDTIILAQHDNPAQYWTPPSPNVCQAVPGLPSNDSQWDGTEAFFGHVLLWKDDRLKWSDKDDFTNWIPVAQTAASAVFTIAAPGYTQPAPGATVPIPVVEDPVAAGIVVGQFIFVQDNRGSGTSNQFYNYYQVTAVGTGPNRITARLQDLTGVTTTGLTIAASQKLFTVDANEAGETRVVGSKMNGRIFKIIAMGDYAYIFKERSIQSVQYVGIESGTFFIHPEVSDEGLLSRTAALNLGDGRIVFLGHKELYLYTGGPRPQPIATQVTRQVLKEIDRTRLNEIVMVHKEIRHEVWISYPIQGGQKTLIWNYVEDSCSFDSYDVSLGGISSAADVDFSTDPPWNSLPDSLTWENEDPTLNWLSFAGASVDRILLIGFNDGQIVVWGFGSTFNRDGLAYLSLSDTMDFDFDEPDIWKYVDVVILGLEIKAKTNQVRTLYVQVGQRAGLGTAEDDSGVTFTAPFPVSVAGDITDVVRINPGGAGRYLRLRFFSQDADVEWAISSFEIHCRPGGFC